MRKSELIKQINDLSGDIDCNVQIVNMDGKITSLWDKFSIRKTHTSYFSKEDALNENTAIPEITIQIHGQDEKKLKII